MTDRELMQQALDALMTCQEDWIFDGEDEYPVDTYDEKMVSAAFKALRARLAQPEPEPVAWMYDWYDETEDIDGVPIGGIVHDWISKDYDEAHSPTMGCHNIRPLYTAPPQREWQGLTDEEMMMIYGQSHEGKKYSLGRAIEAKLKEKNT